MLAHVYLVLERVVQPLKSCVAKNALGATSKTSFLIIILTLFGNIEKVIRWSSIIKALVGIHAMVPVVIFALVLTVLSLVAVQVEESRIDCFKVVLKLLVSRQKLLLGVMKLRQHSLEVSRDLVLYLDELLLSAIFGLLLLRCSLLLDGHLLFERGWEKARNIKD